MASKNSNLHGAKQAKNDEFYTQYHDIEKEMQAYAPFLLEHEYFNEKETRMEFFSLMESISELAQVTKSYSGKELDLILKTLSKKALKKLGKELNHA